MKRFFEENWWFLKYILRGCVRGDLWCWWIFLTGPVLGAIGLAMMFWSVRQLFHLLIQRG